MFSPERACDTKPDLPFVFLSETVNDRRISHFHPGTFREPTLLLEGQLGPYLGCMVDLHLVHVRPLMLDYPPPIFLLATEMKNGEA
jgi:hypothetical protein